MSMNDFTSFNLIGHSKEFLYSLQSIRRFSDHDSTVLILGESGTGKKLAARAIHSLGARREHAFIPVNCGAVPDHLVESEFFGHVKGAFTDARAAKQGLVMSARGGTLFLDEIEAMTPRAQVALLRFLQNKEFRPVGGEVIHSADIRIVAASNTDLFAMAQAGLFRFDLLFRLNVLTLCLPPLRERGDDIAVLAQAFVDRLNVESGQLPKTLHPESLELLRKHHWPGNIRELENVIQRAYVMNEGAEICLGDMTSPQIRYQPYCGPEKHRPQPTTQPDPHQRQPERRKKERRSAPGAHHSQNLQIRSRQTTAEEFANEALPESYEEFRRIREELCASFEKKYLQALLIRSKGNLSLASRLSGKDRSNLHKLLKKHGVDQRAAGRNQSDRADSAIEPHRLP